MYIIKKTVEGKNTRNFFLYSKNLPLQWTTDGDYRRMINFKTLNEAEALFPTVLEMDYPLRFKDDTRSIYMICENVNDKFLSVKEEIIYH